ncbi:MAG TPA: hypothetical protein VGP72_18995 [Planctomycetota bacterium]|jgi:hypothetical protein
MEIYYKTDSRKVRYREYWRITNGQLFPFLIAAVMKTLGVPLDFKSAMPHIDKLLPLEARDVDPAIQSDITPLIERVRGLGAEFHRLYSIPMLTKATGLGLAFVSEDRKTLPQILYSRGRGGGRTFAINSFSCVSKLPDARLIVTSDQPRRFDPAPWVDPVSMPNAPVELVYARHTERLKSLIGPPPIALLSPESLDAFILELNNRELDHKISRGLAVPMTEDEVLRLRAQVGA